MALSKKKYFCSAVISFIALNVFSQVKYSSDPNYLKAKYENNNLITDYQSAYPDTGTTVLPNVIGRNFLGNLSLPQPDYLFKYKSSPLGFNLYPLPFADDVIRQDQVEYYRTKGPYASLTGIAGSKQEQMFKLLFSHTLKNRLNITLKFNRYGSLGFYTKQQTFTNNFNFSTNYTTKNNRFGFYAYFLFNKIKYQENGGVKYDSIIDQNPTINKQLLQINLTNAKRETRQMNAVFNPWLKLNNDSGDVSHYIDYKFNYAGNFYQYKDGAVKYDKFYKNIFNKDSITNDSIHLRQYINEVHYSLKFNKLGLRASLGYRYEYNQLSLSKDSIAKHPVKDSTLQNQQVNFDLYYKKIILNKDSSTINQNKILFSKVTANYIFSGANKNDLKVEWNTDLRFCVDENGMMTKRTNIIYLNILNEQRHPDFIYNFMRGDNFQWNNSYKSVNLFQANLGAKNLRTGLSINALYQSYTNFLYFDTLAAPQQLTDNVSNWSFNLNFDKVLFKHLGIRANLYYQMTNNKNALRYAPSAEKAALYYTGNLFKKNLNLQLGAQVELYQGFKAYDYMPATNIFYIQNRYKVGYYPFVDVFLSGRIKPVQFFVMIGNVLQGFTGSNYNYMPHYYQADRSFRFGLTWLFFD